MRAGVALQAVNWRLAVHAAYAYVLAAALPLALHAQEVDCRKCHEALTAKKVVHAALQDGCAVCHRDIDATQIPHKIKGTIANGLAAEPPALCFKCHERKRFDARVVHAPVAEGTCRLCHDSHASDNPGLLVREPFALCVDCHARITDTPHVIAGFSTRGHPLGGEKRDRFVEDPLRPGKKFYCASCHEPHSSRYNRLTRFDVALPTGYCRICHKI